MTPILNLDPDVEDRASDNDRWWFAKYPSRRYRWRLRLHAANSMPKMIGYVLVTLLHEGVRSRQAVRWFGASLPADSDDQLARLAELLASNEPACIVNGRVCTMAEMPMDGRQ